jgi:hypothetical protein
MPFSAFRGQRSPIASGVSTTHLLEFAMKLSSLTVLALFIAAPAFAADNQSQAFLKKAIEGNYAQTRATD